MISVMAASLHRDLLLVMRRKSEVFTALFFFVIVASLFPLGIGPDPGLLRKIAPGVIWVSALLATLLGLQRILASDYADGTLEQMALSPASLSAMVAGKILAHWLVCGLPLVVLAPVIGLQFDLGASAIGLLMLTLLLGTPVLSLFGSIGVALTVGLGSRGLILAVIVLPLTVPVLIIGAKAVADVSLGLALGMHYSLLGALLALSLSLAPLASAAALKISVN